MRHALALLLLLRHAQTQRCTSLAGPDCEIINGRAPARPPTNAAPAAKPSSWRERLLGVVRAHLEEGRDRADAVKGAFEVRGDLPDARLNARRLALNSRLLCASPTYLARHGEPASPRALTQHRCIVIRESEAAYGTWHLQHQQ